MIPLQMKGSVEGVIRTFYSADLTEVLKPMHLH